MDTYIAVLDGTRGDNVHLIVRTTDWHVVACSDGSHYQTVLDALNATV